MIYRIIWEVTILNNLYEIEDINGVSLKVWNENMAEVRKDFECSRPGDKIKRIKLLL